MKTPGHPVILGGVYGEKHKPPYEYEAKNNTKAIVTREKMRIEFNEEKKVITFSTPGKNTVEISDDDKHIKLTDQNKNEIVMNSPALFPLVRKRYGGETMKPKGGIHNKGHFKDQRHRQAGCRPGRTGRENGG